MNSEERGRYGKAGLAATLLEFEQTPGKFSVARGEPAILFQSSKEILQVASGRSRPSDLGADADAVTLAQAACRFIKAAFLREGADHYTLLGLDRNADADSIKAHYRLMMRLIHPDFTSAGTTAWPKDAATRVNLAYETLASPLQRRNYDEQISQARDDAAEKSGLADPSIRMGRRYGAPSPSERDAIAERSVARAEKARRKLRAAVMLMGVVGALSMAAFALVFERGPQVVLVQRKSAGPSDDAERSPPVSDGLRSTPKSALVAPFVSPTGGSNSDPGLDVVVARTEMPMEPVLRSASNSSAKNKQPTVPKPGGAATVKNSGANAQVPDSEGDPARTVESVSQPPASRPSTPGQAQPASPAAVVPVISRESAASDGEKPRQRMEPMGVPLEDRGGKDSDSTSSAGGVTMAEVQPLLSVLLHELESGRSNNLLRVLDREARSDPSTYAFASYYDGFVSGARSVRITHIDLKPESRQDKLLMRGFVRVELGNGNGFQTKRLLMTAEFAFRSGAVALTRLTGRESADR